MKRKKYVRRRLYDFSMKVEITKAKKIGPSVDTPADLESVRCIINSGKENEYDEIIEKKEDEE